MITPLEEEQAVSDYYRKRLQNLRSSLENAMREGELDDVAECVLRGYLAMDALAGGEETVRWLCQQSEGEERGE